MLKDQTIRGKFGTGAHFCVTLADWLILHRVSRRPVPDPDIIRVF
jgi:hypothetical protein